MTDLAVAIERIERALHAGHAQQLRIDVAAGWTFAQLGERQVQQATMADVLRALAEEPPE